MNKAIGFLFVLFVHNAYATYDITIYLDSEKLVAQKDGETEMVFKVSTGTETHATPTGTNKVIAKNATAYSHTYDSSMPFALRLSDGQYSGINIHFNPHVPDFPASHGCIRTHFKSAIQLFFKISVGTVVEIVNGTTDAEFTVTYDDEYTKTAFHEGDQDPAVNIVQEALVKQKYLTADDVTGTYDQTTMDAVSKFQSNEGLDEDGLAGITTMQTMLAYLNKGF